MTTPRFFEPNTPCEPQWFPRPITDSIESSLDLLERLEDDRKRRLRSIANVVARTPIGLGGVEDRGHAGSAGNLSPKPAGAPANNVRYRYYPPPSDASADLHTSYQRTDTRSSPFMTTTPNSVTTRRDRQYRRGTTPRSIAGSSGGRDTTVMRDGARTPVDGSETAATPADNAYMDDTQDTSYQRNNQSFRSSSSSIQFLSPPLNPRAGGGYSAAGRRSQHVARRPPYHYQRQSPEEGSAYDIDTEASPAVAPREEYVTPPAVAAASQTPGRGRDIYSQRAVASQRRRRRGWDELNS